MAANQGLLQPQPQQQLQRKPKTWAITCFTDLPDFPLVKIRFNKQKVLSVLFLNVKKKPVSMTKEQVLKAIYTTWQDKQVPQNPGYLLPFRIKKPAGGIDSSFVLLARMDHEVEPNVATTASDRICKIMTFLCSNDDGTKQKGQHKMVWVFNPNGKKYQLFKTFRHGTISAFQCAQKSALKALQLLAIMKAAKVLKDFTVNPSKHFFWIRFSGTGSYLFVYSTLQRPLVTLMKNWDGQPAVGNSKGTPGLREAFGPNSTQFDWISFKGACETTYESVNMDPIQTGGMKVHFL